MDRKTLAVVSTASARKKWACEQCGNLWNWAEVSSNRADVTAARKTKAGKNQQMPNTKSNSEKKPIKCFKRCGFERHSSLCLKVSIKWQKVLIHYHDLLCNRIRKRIISSIWFYKIGHSLVMWTSAASLRHKIRRTIAAIIYHKRHRTIQVKVKKNSQRKAKTEGNTTRWHSIESNSFLALFWHIPFIKYLITCFRAATGYGL